MCSWCAIASTSSSESSHSARQSSRLSTGRLQDLPRLAEARLHGLLGAAAGRAADDALVLRPAQVEPQRVARLAALEPVSQRAVAGGEARISAAQLGRLVLDARLQVAVHHAALTRCRPSTSPARAGAAPCAARG